MHARRGEWFLLSCFSLCLLKVFAKRHIDLAFEQDLDGTFVRGGRIHGTFNPQVTTFPDQTAVVSQLKQKNGIATCTD